MNEKDIVKVIVGKKIQEVEPLSITQEFRMLLDGRLCFSSGSSWVLKNAQKEGVIGSSDIDKIFEENEDLINSEDKKLFRKIKVLEGKSIVGFDLNNDNLFVHFDNDYCLISYCTSAEGFIAPVMEY